MKNLVGCEKMGALRCECGRYAKLHSYMFNEFTEAISDVKVKCSRCGIRQAYDWFYEQLRGYE